MMVLSSDGTPELDCGTYAADIGGKCLLPFMTAARAIHCLSCGWMMHGVEYSAADITHDTNAEWVLDQLGAAHLESAARGVAP